MAPMKTDVWSLGSTVLHKFIRSPATKARKHKIFYKSVKNMFKTKNYVIIIID